MKLRNSAFRVVWRLAGATPLPMRTSHCRRCVLGEAAAASEEVRRNTRRSPACSSALPRLRIDSPACRSRVAIAARGPLDPNRGVAQAREPHTDRRFQTSGWFGLFFQTEKKQRRRRGDARQPRPVRALCARQYGMKATIVVPHGNSAEKNAAMRALGAELVEEVAQAITILFQCTHNCASPT